MGRKIVFASGKGGVGKSTIAANLGVKAARLGKEVVLLDADVPMADVALSLGLDVDGPTLHEVLSGEVDLEDAIYNGPEGVSIVPSGISLDGVRKANPQDLGGVLNKLSEKFDIVLIDAPSGLGLGALTSLRESDELVLVTDPVVPSLADALRTKEVAERFNTTPIGAVIAKTVNSDVDVPQGEIKSMLDVPILGEVPEDEEVRKSTSVGDPVIVRKPNSESSKAIQELAEELFVKRGKINYQKLVEENISDIRERAKERDLDYQKLLEAEKENKDRSTLKKWLRTKIKEIQEEEES